jgi:hypothetical protein
LLRVLSNFFLSNFLLNVQGVRVEAGISPSPTIPSNVATQQRLLNGIEGVDKFEIALVTLEGSPNCAVAGRRCSLASNGVGKSFGAIVSSEDSVSRGGTVRVGSLKTG